MGQVTSSFNISNFGPPQRNKLERYNTKSAKLQSEKLSN